MNKRSIRCRYRRIRWCGYAGRRRCGCRRTTSAELDVKYGVQFDAVGRNSSLTVQKVEETNTSDSHGHIGSLEVARGSVLGEESIFSCKTPSTAQK